MATRTPVIELVDYNSGLSWRVTPDEARYWIKRLGVNEFRRQLHEQLAGAIDNAIATAISLGDEVKP